MQALNTADFRGSQIWAGNAGEDDEENVYPEYVLPSVFMFSTFAHYVSS